MSLARVARPTASTGGNMLGGNIWLVILVVLILLILFGVVSVSR